MLKYNYDRLFVSAFHPRDFNPRDPKALRQAVEYLRTLEQTGFVSLTVEVMVTAGRFKLRAPASLKLSEIEGRTPREVWAALDKQVTDQLRSLEQRGK